MRRFLVTWPFNLAALFVAAWLLDGIDYGEDEWALVVAALVFSVANMLVKPIVTVLAIPLIVLTLGIGLFLVNLLMLYLTSWVVSDFEIDGFWWAVAGTIIVWAVNVVLEAVFGRALEP